MERGNKAGISWAALCRFQLALNEIRERENRISLLLFNKSVKRFSDLRLIRKKYHSRKKEE
jgi:hypothetical protein